MPRPRSPLAGLALAALVTAALGAAPLSAAATPAAPPAVAGQASSAPVGGTGSVLLPGQALVRGLGLRSPSGRWALDVTNEGRIALSQWPSHLQPVTVHLQQLVPIGTALWDGGGPDAALVLQRDGNLVLLAPGNRVVGHTGTQGSGASGSSSRTTATSCSPQQAAVSSATSAPTPTRPCVPARRCCPASG